MANEPIVGTWSTSEAGVTGVTTVIFNRDRSFEADMPGNKRVFTGDYTIKGTEVDVRMGPASGVDYPREGLQNVVGILSPDGKHLTFEGSTFTKQ